jgi:hypothetical protein
MSCGDAEQSESGAFGRATVLFPIPKGMDANRTSETRLGQTNETPEGGNVVAGFASTLHQTSANTGGNGSSKVATVNPGISVISDLVDVDHLTGRISDVRCPSSVAMDVIRKASSPNVARPQAT